MHTGCVDEDYLRGGLAFLLGDVQYPLYARARCLRLRANDGKLLAGQCVEQRRLSRVRLSKDTNKPRSYWHIDFLQAAVALLRARLFRA